MPRPHRILLVEDRKLARKTIRAMLGGLDCKLTEVESGEEALKALARSNYDAIILDIRLPGMSGMQMLEEAQALGKSLPPVIILTEHDDAKYAFAAGTLKAFRFVPKGGLEAESFKQIVVSAVNKKREPDDVTVRHCFKHNQFGCNTTLRVSANLVFVGIPFNMRRVFEEGIQPVVKAFGLECWRAKELLRTGDFSCKICGIIQSCEFAIFDISKLSPNVMLELGFAYALGKQVIVLKHRAVEMPSNLSGIEPIEYTSIATLRDGLRKYLKFFLRENAGWLVE